MKKVTASFNYIKSTGLRNEYSLDSSKFVRMVRSWGATLVGVGDVRQGLAKEFRHLPVGISIAVAHPPVKDSIISKGSVTAYTNQFPQIDALLENFQKRIVSYLRSRDWKAFAIPPDTDKEDSSFAASLYPLFPHKTAATCAGLGWVGKNGLLVNPDYGARLSWGTVLTNGPLEVTREPYLKGECHGCSRCVDACPAGALRGIQWTRDVAGEPLLDIEKCALQMEYHRKVIGTCICAHCIVACPVGRREKVLSLKTNKIPTN